MRLKEKNIRTSSNKFFLPIFHNDRIGYKKSNLKKSSDRTMGTRNKNSTQKHNLDEVNEKKNRKKEHTQQHMFSL